MFRNCSTAYRERVRIEEIKELGEEEVRVATERVNELERELQKERDNARERELKHQRENAVLRSSISGGTGSSLESGMVGVLEREVERLRGLLEVKEQERERERARWNDERARYTQEAKVKLSARMERWH